MKRRDRILTTINHREPDRVPIGFDMHPGIEKELCHYYGVDDLEGVYQKTGVDCFSVWNPLWSALPHYISAPRAGVQTMDSTYGCWGKVGEHIYPLALESLETYRWLKVTDFDFSHLKSQLEEIRQRDMTCASGHAGVGWLHHVQMRSYDHCLLDVLDDAWMSDYMAHNHEFFIPYFETLFQNAAGLIDIIRADEDLGGHEAMLISPRLWRKWYKPLWKEVFDICHRNGAKIWMHSCGFCRSVLEDFIEIGVDILNPIPPYVRGGEPGEMKQRFGHALAFDGGIDQMRVLVSGTIKQVEDEVRKRIDQIAPGGGYILGPSQVFTDDIPVKNIVAMFEACLKFGQYK